MPPLYGAPGKYRALLEFLEALPPSEQSVTLTLDAIAAMIGAPLPPSALTISYWTSAVAKTNWQRSGFRGRLNATQVSVTFTRVAAGQK